MTSYARSLQSMLTIVIVLVALPGLIGFFYLSIVERQNALDAAREYAANTVALVVDEQKKLIEETELFLKGLSSLEEVHDPESPECSSALANILKTNTVYVNLGVPRVDGELLCNAHPLTKRVNVADRPYIQKAIGTKDFSIGSFQVDRAAGVTSINFAYPVVHPATHELVGLAVAVVSLDWWSQRLAQSRLPEDSVAYIIDKDKNIIATYPGNNEILGAPISEVEPDQANFDPDVSGKNQEASGHDAKVFVSQSLFSSGDLSRIHMSVGIPMGERLSEIDTRLIESSAVFLASVILMLLLASWGVRRSVLSPIQSLIESMKRVQQSSEIDHLPTRGVPEIVELQECFYQMTKTQLEAEKKLKSSQDSLKESERRLSGHVENTPLGCISWDKDFRCTEWNKSAEKIFGYSADEAIGKHASEMIVEPEHREEVDTVFSLLLEGKGGESNANKNITKDGRVIVCEWHNTPILALDGSVEGVTSLVQDVTEVKKYQRQLEHIAHYDVLTGLPNRALLADRLHQAIAQARRHDDFIAVVFLDLDGFKAVNDVNGHDVGDKLLLELSFRLKEALREGDTLSRFGGDEFVAVVPDLQMASDVEPILLRLLKGAAQSVVVSGISLRVSASIGVTLYPMDDSDADQLIRHADQAMYIAKQKGKNCYYIFDPVSDGTSRVRHETIQRVTEALSRSEFVLYYQPKVNMRTGAVIGVEALLRWQHPERGLLSPLEFLPYVENHPISIDIGEWVIDEALTQIERWQDQGLDIPVSINVGAMQLQQHEFADRLGKVLREHPDVLPHYLQLEVLETSALEDIKDASEVMNRCVQLGVSFAIDDFGTGYSSLTYLKRLPVTLIKIDQTFIRDMLDDPEDFAIVVSVVGLASSFNLSVIAEGVETISHGTALLKLGCELAQGYGIARPLPASGIPEWASSWRPDPAWSSTDGENSEVDPANWTI